MRVAVGSTNPVKVGAVREAFERAWGEEVAVSGRTVPSGVSEMPMTDAECIAGARNRAMAVLLGDDSADFGVGLEGGVNKEPVGLMLLGWVVVRHRDGREGLACTAKVPLPASIASRVLNGEELGPVMDDILREHNTAKRGGASGALSRGLVLRKDKFSQAVAYALAPFLAPQLYR